MCPAPPTCQQPLASPETKAPLPERVWDLKPWWCQPWSIVATGLALVAGSWWLLQRLWLSAVVAIAVALWWWLFLVLMPSEWRDMIRHQGEDPERSDTSSDNPDRAL